MRSLFVYSLPLLLAACSTKTEENKTTGEPKKDSITVAKTDTVTIRDCKVLYYNAKSIDSTIMQKLDMDMNLATKAIKAFADYAFYCESDSLSPVYLIKGAQIAISINNANQAKVLLDRCISNYPKFRNKPAAIFLLAQMYDEQHLLNNEEEAKKLYEQLIFEYPRSEWAANAKGAIKLMGKTDEEIIKEFNEKNKKGTK
ncbi:MAG: tetratricopeptide repeat protein [Sphingobacteriaceae bacterium]|jgi:TolA-binding protein